MYSSRLDTKDRTTAIIAALALQLALLIAFLNLARELAPAESEPSSRLVDLRITPLSAPTVAAKRVLHQKSGGSASASAKSRAEPVVERVPVRIAAPLDKGSPTVAHEATTLASGTGPVDGSGDAGGGIGTGSGTGLGSGSADAADIVDPPHLASAVLSGLDFSRDMLYEWPRSATIFLRLKIDARGYVAECIVDRGTHVPLIDSAMCNTAHERLRFRPALNRSGKAVAGWFGYAQPSPR